MMLRRYSATVLLLSMTALVVLPACGKKKSADDEESPAPGGPYGPVEPGMPAHPGPGPHLRYDTRTSNETRSKLKLIGTAMHWYHDTANQLPVGIADKSGRLGLSWRVALLPYLEADNLYRQFKRDEPWNSEHNKKLIPMMPKVFAAPGMSTNGYTYYRSFAGRGALMEGQLQKIVPGEQPRGVRLSGILDGTSNTMMLAEAFDPTIWTKPDDLPFEPGKPPRLGGGLYADLFHALMCDGSVRQFKTSLDSKAISNLIQTNDGQIVEIPD
jgi:hypothetical protein